MYTPVIDYDVPLADYAPTFQDLRDRVASAVAALEDLDYLPEPTEEDRRVSRAIFAGEQGASDTDLSSPGVVMHVAALLNEYDRTVVKSAAQLRTYVTNKLILESDNPDPKVRIRALELLGKISDVGLFSDRTEVTITHQSTDELKQSLRDKLNKLRAKMDVVDVTPIESKPLNLDEELGIPAPETAKIAENLQKTAEYGGAN